ncbi:4-alpha-glucanotransferase [Aureimonas populi]|uniref:4-alpha-glucanotransferase n=1 Tax=Aureimonas populi TaxID=1701758 RepID=A0ABW5CQN2_9HYPH|nr:4-alpha-glucanotransferase [Aureimonas populi]
MTEWLDDLAASHGIQTRYITEQGEEARIPDHAKEALLRILKVDPASGEAGHFEGAQHKATRACHMPDWLAAHRVWGVACQLYALRSRRSLGLGDFEDLARLAEIAARGGASFLGVSPLHALFLADPARCSPYSPSTRRFLNPLYIAVDRLPGGPEAIEALRAKEPSLFETLDGDLVDYPAVGRLKRTLLRALFEESTHDAAFDAFRVSGGKALREFTLFEAISAMEVEAGRHAGWHEWSQEMHHLSGGEAGRFARDNEDEITFHQWLQFVADRQLGEAQARARAAGMRVGLYLDFAVGVAPDGADTWADPQLAVPQARVGAPPDLFNAGGQDWGLAPLSPDALAQRGYRPLAEAYRAIMKHAGAIRIDHAMGLARLWWIPQGHESRDGGYVRYPLGAMIDTVADVSDESRCLVIGEDLGTVPDGFRPQAHEANILSYRVLYFERTAGEGFVAPSAYPELALACVSTHDLATLSGWWAGTDVELRAQAGRQDEASTAREREERRGDRKALLSALAREGLLPQGISADAGKMTAELAAAVHRYGARARSLLFAVQLDDMIGARRQPNLPGTMDEYPNWRIRCELPLEEIEADARFQTIARALREERPES